MEKILSNLNANSVATQLNGSAGEIRIFANLAIKSNAPAITSVSTRNSSCQNVKVQEYVPQEEITMETANRECWAAQFAEITNKIIKDFDRISVILNYSLL